MNTRVFLHSIPGAACFACNALCDRLPVLYRNLRQNNGSSDKHICTGELKLTLEIEFCRLLGTCILRRSNFDNGDPDAIRSLTIFLPFVNIRNSDQ
jgi:hypothetical protein